MFSLMQFKIIFLNFFQKAETYIEDNLMHKSQSGRKEQLYYFNINACEISALSLMGNWSTKWVKMYVHAVHHTLSYHIFMHEGMSFYMPADLMILVERCW